MTTLVPSRLLRAALVIDAVGTAPVALLHVAGGVALVQATGIPQDMLYGTGAFCLVYVALLAWLAMRRRLPVGVVTLIVLGNVAWACATLGLAFGAGWPLTGYGEALVAVHVVAVLLFAALQYRGLQQSTRSDGAARAVPAT